MQDFKTFLDKKKAAHQGYDCGDLWDWTQEYKAMTSHKQLNDRELILRKKQLQALIHSIECEVDMIDEEQAQRYSQALTDTLKRNLRNL